MSLILVLAVLAARPRHPPFQLILLFNALLQLPYITIMAFAKQLST